MHFKKYIFIILCLVIHGNFLVMGTNSTGDFVVHKFEVNTTTVYFDFAEIDELQNPADSDRVLLMTGKEIVCEVKRVTDKFVFYTMPNSDTPDWIARGEVHSIRYRNGEVVDFSTFILANKEENDWRRIKLTKFSKDVEGLTKIDDIDVRFEAKDRKTYRSAIALERGAEIVVMKQASSINADIVFISNIKHIRAYGDPPVIIMNCEAYRKP